MVWLTLSLLTELTIKAFSWGVKIAPTNSVPCPLDLTVTLDIISAIKTTLVQTCLCFEDSASYLPPGERESFPSTHKQPRFHQVFLRCNGFLATRDPPAHLLLTHEYQKAEGHEEPIRE